MNRLGNWMLEHPWSVAWLAVMVVLEMVFLLTGVGAESVREVAPR